MVHERDDKYDGQEDGEYHFSDDQGSYDIEPEIAPKPVTATKGPVAAASLSGSFNQYRKPIIGVGVFVLLIFLVYKISAPSSQSQPTTEFAQNAGTIPAKNPVMKQLPKTIKTADSGDTASGFQPLPQAAGMSNGSPTGRPAAPVTEASLPSTPETTASAMPTSQPGMPISATTNAPSAYVPPAPIPEVTTTTQNSMPTPGMAATGGVPNPSLPAPAENYYNPQHPPAVVVAEAQESAKLVAEYSQKLAAAEAQNSVLQNKVDDLTMRLASMETTLTHLSKSIQDMKQPSNGGSGRGGEMAVAPLEQQTASSSGEPKSTYSVQAIIPGRAWLKSDGGDTVTVAEGDTLKNYGRIVKIDPYDGVVQIDTGGRMMSLAYGVSSE